MGEALWVVEEQRGWSEGNWQVGREGVCSQTPGLPEDAVAWKGLPLAAPPTQNSGGGRRQRCSGGPGTTEKAPENSQAPGESSMPTLAVGWEE